MTERTITGAVVSGKLVEVGDLVSLVIPVHGPQDGWPGFLEHQVTFTRTDQFLSLVVHDCRFHTKEGQGRGSRLHWRTSGQ